MAPLRRWALAALLVSLSLAACGEAPSDEVELDDPAIVEPIAGSDLARVTLTAPAAARLNIQTTPVQSVGRSVMVPSAAVLVDPNGEFWVYVSLEPLVFVRRSISVDHEEDGRVFLSEGPSAGTRVVTVGVAELYGAEFEIGH